MPEQTVRAGEHLLACCADPSAGDANACAHCGAALSDPFVGALSCQHAVREDPESGELTCIECRMLFCGHITVPSWTASRVRGLPEACTHYAVSSDAGGRCADHG